MDIAAFVPRWVRTSLAEAGSDLNAASIAAHVASVLLFDIAGFTEITDRLAQQGDVGAEQLSELLNDCFTVLTDVVDAYGGDVVSFTGDGFLALWDDPEPAQTIHVAAHCALALRDAMARWAPASQSGIRQRICVDAGTVHYCRLGGHGDAWRYAVVGTPLQNLGLAYRKARIGEVLLCDAAWRPISDVCEGEAGDGFFELSRLKRSCARPKRPPLPPISEASMLEYRNLLPAAVLARLNLGAARWLAEFRTLSVLYINFAGASFEEDLAGFLQPCILTVQRIVLGLEGIIFGVWMDDKGICAAALFGTPPLAHEEDALRAVEAGLRMREELGRNAIRASIGVSSGKLFCGEIGGRSRRDYGVFGPAVNTAARLMERADGGVLCDEATAQAVGGRVSFAVLQEQRLKGRSAPIALYRPIGILPARQPSHDGEIVGRDYERRQLRARLEQVKAGVGGLVIVQGEGGIGKSRLLADLAEAASRDGILSARGFASAIDKATPYFAWRPVLLALLERDLKQGDPDALRAGLAARLRHEKDLVSWLPLLRDILPLALPETPLTEQIAGGARAASIEALVVGLLLHSPAPPRLIIFEDLHWLDEASLSLLRGVVRQLPQILIVASRRLPEPKAAQDARLIKEQTLEISLGDLPTDAIAEIIRRRLRATGVAPEVVSFVCARAGGNPFYCEELAAALRDARRPCVPPGREPSGRNCGRAEILLSGQPGERHRRPRRRPSCGRPTSVEGCERDRRAVHGRAPAGSLSRWPVRARCRIDARSTHRSRIASGRKKPCRQPYQFRHAISEEVTYSLLPFIQRRVLHASIAAALERDHAGHLEPYYGPLARHWERAQDVHRAISYLELAADQALRGFANHDAIQYIRTAFDLSKTAPDEESDERFARWETIRGDAYNELANYHQSLPHYERALLLGGHKIARNGRERAAGLLRNLASQGWRRAAPSRFAQPRVANTDVARRAAHIRERLAERHFFRNESAAVLDETLAAVNLAEGGGAVMEMMSGYSALALGLGMSGLSGLARFYQRRAIELAERFDPAPESARAFMLTSVLGFGTGDWAFAMQSALRSLTMYRQLGDRARALTPLTIWRRST